MRIAFYAPLKPPDHPVPSGDRQMARSLLHALAFAGHDPFVASTLRTFDATGDRERQLRLRRVGTRIAERLIARLATAPRPQLWLTYHVHHKAPDHLGALVSRALAIPYVIAEASIAPRRRDGPWADGYAAAYAAIRAADTVVFVNPVDLGEVRKARGTDAADAMLSPFIDVAAFCGARVDAVPAAREGPVQLVTVAMMRAGAKVASYRVLGEALARLTDLRWRLSVVGDGPARRDVEAALAPLGDRVRFCGAQPRERLATLLAAHDVFLWPAVDEAFGIAFLEAQACGVPVIGADTPGVRSIVAAGRTGLLCPAADVEAFAAATRRLVVDGPMRRRMAHAACAHVRERHDLPAGAGQLDTILRRAVERRAAWA